MKSPLADRIRPEALDDVVGQKHLIGEGKVLRKLIEQGEVPNMIFYGPSGVGKTTVANIIAKKTGKSLYKLNATTASVSDVKDIIASLDTFITSDGVLLYLDEIQHFNKKQQQSLLEFMENGKITLIASTTENPYFYVYNAVLSRSVVFEFMPVNEEEIKEALKRAADMLSQTDYKNYKVSVSCDALSHIAYTCGGDVRRALNSLEVCFLTTSANSDNELIIDENIAVQATQKKVIRYDKGGDNQYDMMSALQKSIRGSDPDAAIYYLAKILAAGDLISACRRLLVIASEDVGLAYSQAAVVTKACVDSALQLGMPEARVPLAHAAVLLATSPKSNSSYAAINSALYDLEHIDTGTVPRQLQNVHCDGEGNSEKGQNYLYPHDFPNHYVKQQYLPDKIKDKVYYVPGENKAEKNASEYWKKIKENS